MNRQKGCYQLIFYKNSKQKIRTSIIFLIFFSLNQNEQLQQSQALHYSRKIMKEIAFLKFKRFFLIQNPAFSQSIIINMSIENTSSEPSHHLTQPSRMPVSVPSPSLTAILEQRSAHLNPTMSISYNPNPLHLSHAQNVHLFQSNGQSNLDCINNVSHIGHCHPEFIRRVDEQSKVLQTNSRFLYDVLQEATEKLLRKFPKELSVVTFCNSGSEANDLAMQMAEICSKKRGVVCLEGAYHGVTKSTMEVSPYKWNQKYPRPEHVIVAQSPCTYRGYLQNHTPEDYANYINSIITPQTGTFISQLMQSCAGQVIPPANFYSTLYPILKSHNIITIADQVQTGFGRLGSHFWAFQYYNVVPDIVTCGKAMGNGFPVAAVICRKEIAEQFRQRNIEFFSTFGGNPMAMAATCAVLDVIDKERLQQNASETGSYLRQKLEEMREFPWVGDVRGSGLFQGVEIVTDKETKGHDGDRAKRIIAEMRKRGVLVSRDGTEHNILKIKPPITFNKQNVDTLIETLRTVLKDMVNELEHLSTTSSQDHEAPTG